MPESDNFAPLTGSEDRSLAGVGEQQPDFPNWKIYGFEILAKLSEREDGERITYLAKEIKSDRSIVIKEWRLRAANMRSRDYASYLPEIGRLQQLDYPNIPPYLNSFPTSTGFCLVRAYQPGVSLAEIAPLPPGDIQRIADKVLHILSQLQQLTPNLVHQNLKPENIIVNTNERLMVYLVDFGLTAAGTLPAAGLLASNPGTRGFMPPEYSSDRPPAASTDIYGLGVSLICLLADIPTARALELADDRGRLNFHHLVPENTPLALIASLDKMVEPNERDRFINAKSVGDLTVAKSSIPQSSQLAVPKKQRPKIKRWYWLLAAGGLLVTIGLLVRQFGSSDPGELSPAQIAKNQQLARQAAFVASDRGKLTTEKRCIGCNFKSQNFAKADMTGVELSQSTLAGSNFANANLTLAIFRDADLSGANLERANLQQAALYGAKLLGTKLVGANLTNSKLIYANLAGADLQSANLTNADLKSAELPQANLTAANLTGADLSNADLAGANLHRATLMGAKLDGANLTGATMPDGSIYQKSARAVKPQLVPSQPVRP